MILLKCSSRHFFLAFLLTEVGSKCFCTSFTSVVYMLLFVFIHISRRLFFVCLYVSRCAGFISSLILLLHSTFYHSSCPAVSAQVSSSSSILSSSCSMSSSIISSCPVASSRAVRAQYCRPRCLWPRRTLRLRPFLFVPNEDD